MPDNDDQVDEGETLSWNMQMKLHAIECLINVFSLPEMFTDARVLLEEVIKHLDATFKSFIAAMSQEN